MTKGPWEEVPCRARCKQITSRFEKLQKRITTKVKPFLQISKQIQIQSFGLHTG